MKKTKVLLTALLVFAAIGGTLAFKSYKLDGQLYCSSVSGTGGGICGTSATRYSIHDEPTELELYCTSNPAGPSTPCEDQLTEDLIINPQFE